MKTFLKFLLFAALLVAAFIAGWQAHAYLIRLFSTEDKLQRMFDSMQHIAYAIEKVEAIQQAEKVYPKFIEPDALSKTENQVYYMKCDGNAYLLSTYLFERVFLDYRGGEPKYNPKGWSLHGEGVGIEYLGP